MSDQFFRRRFFDGRLLAGLIPGGFGSTPSLLAAGYRSSEDNAEGEFSNSIEANRWVEAVYREG
jgi:hypothetical protein